MGGVKELMSDVDKRIVQMDFDNKKFEKKPNEPMTLEDIERWIKKNSNHEKPRRSRANSLGEYKKNKRRH